MPTLPSKLLACPFKDVNIPPTRIWPFGSGINTVTFPLAVVLKTSTVCAPEWKTIAHIVMITWGYAGGSLIGSVRTFWSLTVDYPGMLLAVAGTACLVMVVVTSVKAAGSQPATSSQ